MELVISVRCQSTTNFCFFPRCVNRLINESRMRKAVTNSAVVFPQKVGFLGSYRLVIAT